ncbi:fructosamine kinase family protein [Aquimarina sp. ERC-38]|uniref:fructosamine kinase family protein n=1 Tax=Aquimarina sp. ERC-38 TaxID=2949996 RepID=UPI002247B02F|nr:fructosamine kinase family protein [Aquimarina sp. ERC-38]UZO81045.1 fructosamine kinase family protein [Aquimarina sp. ERC-38]
MITTAFKAHLQSLFNFQLQLVQPLSGGDINQVYLITTDSGKLVVKVNNASKFPKMFEKEAQGLALLQKTNTFKIPEVIGYGTFNEQSYLLLEYITLGSKDQNFWKLFGKQLVTLHKHTSATFGLEADNYIGSLLQYNKKHINSAEFYVRQRLQPQLELAAQNGYIFSNTDKLYNNIEAILPDEPPALIHGDLWSGNFMVNENALPVLIDPAVSYAPREMDLALMLLFGGFDPMVFEEYDNLYPLESGWRDRTDIFQLYYILVHLNLFGTSYYGQAKEIISKYN